MDGTAPFEGRGREETSLGVVGTRGKRPWGAEVLGKRSWGRGGALGNAALGRGDQGKAVLGWGWAAGENGLGIRGGGRIALVFMPCAANVPRLPNPKGWRAICAFQQMA